jgi:alkylation response protein AidB-like acyl-CoA dehydrogenase
VTISLEERSLLLESVDTVARKRIAPRAAEIDATGEFPRDIYAAFGELGLFGVFVPPEYGGETVDVLTRMLIAERISRVSAACGCLFANCGDAAEPIVLGATEEVKREVLPRIASGEAVPCYCLTEPGCGSDAAALRTTARRDGDRYFISGSKQFITNGSVADYYVVFARTGGPGPHGISAFLLERGAHGLEIGRTEDLLGMRGAPTAQLTFSEVEVPVGWRLGEESDGFKLAMSALDEGRLGVGAFALGLARGALEIAFEYAKDREAFGKPIIQHQGLGFLVSDQLVDLAAAYRLWRHAIDEFDRDHSRAASALCGMAKMATTNMAMRVTTEAVQILGGVGLTRELPAERMFRDAKILQVFEGSTQIQQWVIARHVEKHGLPFAQLGW